MWNNDNFDIYMKCPPNIFLYKSYKHQQDLPVNNVSKLYKTVLKMCTRFEQNKHRLKRISIRYHSPIIPLQHILLDMRRLMF
jgi:hypothetical protein